MKILFNPQGKHIEFRYDGRVFQFAPGEKQNLEDAVANHALKTVNTGLVEYDPAVHKSYVGNLDYNAMPWRQLLKHASEIGVFRPGMRKKEVLEAILELEKDNG